MDNLDDARNSLVTAALRVAAAERGGLDQENASIELKNARRVLDREVRRYTGLLNNEEYIAR